MTVATVQHPRRPTRRRRKSIKTRTRRASTPTTAARTREVKIACELSTWTGEGGKCHWCNTPLTGRQRSWCSVACRRAFERNHVWSRARAAARRRDKYTCRSCGATEHLEVNHTDPVNGNGYGMSCKHHQDKLETLCHDCHVPVTNAQAAARKTEARQLGLNSH